MKLNVCSPASRTAHPTGSTCRVANSMHSLYVLSAHMVEEPLNQATHSRRDHAQGLVSVVISGRLFSNPVH